MIRTGTLLLICLLGFTAARAEMADQTVYLYPGILTPCPTSPCLCLSVAGISSFVLENYGGFGAGDTVIVAADHRDVCPCGDVPQLPCLQGNTIATWRNHDFGCGDIWRSSGNCYFFSSAAYGVIGLDSHPDVEAGKSRLNGNLYICGPTIPECAAVACLKTTQVRPCPDVPVSMTTWGGIKSIYR